MEDTTPKECATCESIVGDVRMIRDALLGDLITQRPGVIEQTRDNASAVKSNAKRIKLHERLLFGLLAAGGAGATIVEGFLRK